jgi:CheY-like chemotaxis protein
MKRILIVDDDPDLAHLTMTLIIKMGIAIEAEIISRGEAVLPFLRREFPFLQSRTPHVILLDLHMPGKDGFAVLADLKMDSQLKSIPVVILTATLNQSDIDRCYAAGVNSVISKSDVATGALKTFADFWLKVVRLPQTA